VPLCANCGAENPDGQRFCGSCGSALAATCSSCGAANPAGQRFCGDCGSPLAEAPAAAPATAASAPQTLVSERRLVSLLFADLVGFTTLSESRDAEEVRELLSRYFDTCRRLVELYGGTVEKFIGDAVMAVWGTPVATEDDAERAVRAAIDLVAAVTALGDELGAPGLRARAGVLTGEAAVNLAAVGEGMVAGDLVNTASRVQSVAEPGTVFVGEATRRATEQAIAYEPAGSFELKGKEGETPLWQALRVVSGVRGQLKSEGLEAPFVGRDGELRRLKDLFHACADERRAQLVSVTGLAGIGKSRLGWEFYKYIDGLADTTYWHRGRCLAYGEGVTYWALADMVRMRCLIAEDDQPETGLQKLRAALDEHLLDSEERRFVEPRLAQLLGLGEPETRERQDLFAAWRLFFERLSDTHPTVLLFEDMQWADASLLDFVEYLLEWSRNHPLFVVTLARPELIERRPNWGAGHRSFTSLYLDPLPEQTMEELLAGLVPGLPESVRDQVLARAEGVPLYAVETVRMLLDRGLLVQEGAVYGVAGEIESLEVPETLHALIAARLDGLSTEERRLLGDAAVLGKSFAPDALSSLTGLERDRLDELLRGLVRREVLGLQSDPRSPEEGQYGFLQDLLRHVAYETLSRRERRAKHLAAAEYISTALADEEVAEVVASHLLDAYRLDPDAPDAAAIKAQARGALVRAGERAASLGASTEALRYFERAVELSDEPADQAAALSRAGEMALATGDADRSGALFERAIGLHESAGNPHAAARASSMLALAEQYLGHYEQAIERMEKAYAVIAEDEPDADLAFLLTRLGNASNLAGNREQASEWIERGLDVAEALQLPDPLVRGWIAMAYTLEPRRPVEAFALLRLAHDTALEHELHAQASVAAGLLSDFEFRRDRYSSSVAYLERSLDLGRRIGDRRREWFALSEMSYALAMLGRWDDALVRLAEIPDEQIGTNSELGSVLSGVLELYLHRGELDRGRTLLARFDEVGQSSSQVQMQGCYQGAVAALRFAEGNASDALAAADRAFETHSAVGISSQDVKLGFLHALEAALELDDRDKADEMLAIVEALPIGLRPPFLDAMAHRFRARLAGDGATAGPHFETAAEKLCELGLPFHLAVVRLEYAEALEDTENAQVLRAEARETFDRLQAIPWLQRVDSVGAAERSEIPA
jgi:class 3 adenylate cyclase/tetratricopeptide (TPR) repeat protein